jgi:cell division septation protein DedD
MNKFTASRARNRRELVPAIRFPHLMLCGLATLCAVPAIADVKDGVDAWSRGDYAAAIRQWQGPAEQGDPDAQFNLAQAYKLGRGVSQDLTRAEQLFARAAAQGHLQAADNLGLLMFQRGDRAGALPYIKAASGRGDPRAHYVLGLAYFNGDGVAKNWERAYALVSLAQQAGLPQATAALTQMDQYIPLEARQRSVALAATIAGEAEQARRAQVAAADLDADARPSRSASLRPFDVPAATDTAKPGADYTPGRAPPVASIMASAPPPPKPAPPVTTKPLVVPKPRFDSPSPQAVQPRPASTGGSWRVQLGAFGVRANADTLWNKVKGRPELAGHARLIVPAGKVVRLQAGGFASQESAQAACSRLKAGGFDCMAVDD